MITGFRLCVLTLNQKFVHLSSISTAGVFSKGTVLCGGYWLLQISGAFQICIAKRSKVPNFLFWSPPWLYASSVKNKKRTGFRFIFILCIPSWKAGSTLLTISYKALAYKPQDSTILVFPMQKKFGMKKMAQEKLERSQISKLAMKLQ